MVSSRPGGPDRLTRAYLTSLAQRATILDLNGSTMHRESQMKGLQLQLSDLRQCLCELLIENQQLRMTLMERNAKETEDRKGDR